MKVVLEISDRFNKSVQIYSDDGKIIDELSSPEKDFFAMFHEVLMRNKLDVKDIKEVSVVSQSSSSRTSIKTAYAIANALNYSLGIKKLTQLSFPEKPAEFYSALSETS